MSRGRPLRVVAATATSIMCHVVALGWLVRTSAEPAGADPTSMFVLQGVGEGEQQAAVSEIGLVAVDEVFPSTVPGAPAPARALDDESRRVVKEESPRLAMGHDPRAPASDQGSDHVRRGIDDAFRRDRSTLRERLSDGAPRYQTARTRTSVRDSSPTAERHEPRVGRGTTPRSAKPNVPAHDATLDPTLPAEDDGSERAAQASSLKVAQEGSDRGPAGDGPLEASAGARAFDVETPGASASALTTRAASAEPHPGLADLAAPGRRTGDGLSGSGPALAPGVVAHASRGETPSLYGAPVPVPRGDAVSYDADAFLRSPEYREITKRVASVLTFPKRLALRLEQGESIVRFTVAEDGRLSGEVALVKSSGFAEFDDEARNAVRRAAPFPRQKRARTLDLRVPFENPVVR